MDLAVTVPRCRGRRTSGRASRRTVHKPRPAGLIAALLALLALSACRGDAALQQRVIPVFGTIVQVDVAGTDKATAQTALDALETLYQRLDRDWRSFGPGELGRVNDRLAAGEPAVLSPELRHLVARSLQIRDLSGGLFDPRVGPLVELWGFQDMAQRTPDTPPADAAIAQARAGAIGAAVLHLEGNHLRSDHPVRLDLAGIAKGSALLAGSVELRAHGVGNALLVAGGDVLALGSRGDRPWRVGVRNPLKPGILGSVDLASGEAAVSSGDYERRFESGGKFFHHIIDPRTGRPARGTAGTTVIGRDVELANAAATALLVGGAGQFADLTRLMAIEYALLVTEDGTMLMTSPMQARLRPP